MNPELARHESARQRITREMKVCALDPHMLTIQAQERGRRVVYHLLCIGPETLERSHVLRTLNSLKPCSLGLFTTTPFSVQALLLLATKSFSMAGKLEEAALSGKLFQPPSRPTSPSRSEDEEPNTDDELGSDLSRPTSPQPNQAETMPREGAQTGPKGVLADRSQSRREQESLAALQLDEVKRAQKNNAMVAMTVDEEEAEKRRLVAEAESREDDIARMKWRRERREELERARREGGQEENVEHRKGGLREIDGDQFVYAVERPGWVVVLVYEQVSELGSLAS